MATRTNVARSRPAFTQSAARSKVYKSKCDENQSLVDIIAKKRENYQGSNFGYTLKRAMESMCQAKEPITTYDAAIALPYIGPSIASILFQKELPTNTKKKGTAAGNLKRTQVDNNNSDDHKEIAPISDETSTTKSKKAKSSSIHSPYRINKRQKQKLQTLLATKEVPSRKEAAYQKAVEEAESCYRGKNLIWKLVLLIDRRERKAEHYSSKVQQCGIPTEIRNLPIGDMTWIAQGCTRSDPDKVVAELLLGTIIERKEVADLKSSLFGTRYNEQQLRLKESGQPQVIFLVEGDLKKDLYRCSADTLHSTLWAIRIEKGNQVIQTEHMEHTVQTLRRMHRRMLKRTFPTAFYTEALPTFAGPEARNHARRKRDSFGEQRRRRRRRLESLHGLTFDEEPVPMAGMDRFTTYKELCAKVERDRESGRCTVGGIHQAMLKQVTSISDTKIPAICELYPTMCSLLQAYQDAEGHETSRTLLQSLPLHNPGVMEKTAAAGTRTLGARSAAEMYIAYGMRGDGNDEDSGEEGGSGILSAGGAPKYSALVQAALKNQQPSAAAVAAAAASSSADCDSEPFINFYDDVVDDNDGDDNKDMRVAVSIFADQSSSSSAMAGAGRSCVTDKQSRTLTSATASCAASKLSQSNKATVTTTTTTTTTRTQTSRNDVSTKLPPASPSPLTSTRTLDLSFSSDDDLLKSSGLGASRAKKANLAPNKKASLQLSCQEVIEID